MPVPGRITVRSPGRSTWPAGRSLLAATDCRATAATPASRAEARLEIGPTATAAARAAAA